MATSPAIQAIENRIYSAALDGTPTNSKGLPPSLALLLVAQAKHETGNFTSSAYKLGNNAFGYSYVSGAKWQLPAPGRIADNGLPLAQYANVEDSTKEVVDWIYRRVREGKFPADLATITSAERYASLLKQAGYYGDTLSNYTTGLKRFLADLVPEAVKDNPGTVLLLTALGAFIAWRLLKK